MYSLRKLRRFSHQRKPSKLLTGLALVLLLATLLLLAVPSSLRTASNWPCGAAGSSSSCTRDHSSTSSRVVPLRLRNTTTKNVISRWVAGSKDGIESDCKKGKWIPVPTAELTGEYRKALLAAVSLPAGVCASIPHKWVSMSRIDMETHHCSQRLPTQRWKTAVAAATGSLLQGGKSDTLEVNLDGTKVDHVPVVLPRNSSYDGGVTLFLQGTHEYQARCSWMDKMYNVGRSYQPECFMLCMQHGFDALLFEKNTTMSVNASLYLPVGSTTKMMLKKRSSSSRTNEEQKDVPSSSPLLSYMARPAYVPRLFPFFSMEEMRQSAYRSSTNMRVSVSPTALDLCHESQKHVDVPECLLAGYRESSTGARPLELKISAAGKIQHPSILVIGHSHGRYMASSLCQMLRMPMCMLFPQVKTSILSLFTRDVPFDVLAHGYAALAADAAQLLQFGPSSQTQYTPAEQSVIQKLAQFHNSGLLNGSRHVEREAEEELRSLLDNDSPLLTFTQSTYSSVMKVERVERFFDEEVWKRPISEQTSWYVNLDPHVASKENPTRKYTRTPAFTHVVFARGTWDALLRDLPVSELIETYTKSVLVLLERFPSANVIVSLMHYHHEAGGGYGDMLAFLWRQNCFSRNQLDKFRAVTLCAAHKAQQTHEQRKREKMQSDPSSASTSPRPIYIYDMWYPSATDYSRSLVCSTGHHYRDTVMESLTMMLVNQQICPLARDSGFAGKVKVDDGPELSFTQEEMLGRILTAERGEAACAALEAVWHEKPSYWCGPHILINQSVYMKNMFGGNVPPLDVDDEANDHEV